MNVELDVTVPQIPSCDEGRDCFLLTRCGYVCYYYCVITPFCLILSTVRVICECLPFLSLCVFLRQFPDLNVIFLTCYMLLILVYLIFLA